MHRGRQYLSLKLLFLQMRIYSPEAENVFVQNAKAFECFPPPRHGIEHLVHDASSVANAPTFPEIFKTASAWIIRTMVKEQNMFTPPPHVWYQIESGRKPPAMFAIINHPKVLQVVIRIAHHSVENHLAVKPFRIIEWILTVLSNNGQ